MNPWIDDRLCICVFFLLDLYDFLFYYKLSYKTILISTLESINYRFVEVLHIYSRLASLGSTLWLSLGCKNLGMSALEVNTAWQGGRGRRQDWAERSQAVMAAPQQACATPQWTLALRLAPCLAFIPQILCHVTWAVLRRVCDLQQGGFCSYLESFRRKQCQWTLSLSVDKQLGQQVPPCGDIWSVDHHIHHNILSNITYHFCILYSHQFLLLKTLCTYF